MEISCTGRLMGIGYQDGTLRIIIVDPTYSTNLSLGNIYIYNFELII